MQCDLIQWVLNITLHDSCQPESSTVQPVAAMVDVSAHPDVGMEERWPESFPF